MSEHDDPLLAEPARQRTPPDWTDALVLGASLFLLVWNLGAYGLYEPHEGHFAGVGREMVLTGEYIVPHLNGSPYLNKPPLLYWSVALCNLIFGISEFSARLPSALYAWLGVVVAWHWAAQLWGRQTGRLAAGMLTVSAGWFLFAHQAMIDAQLAAFVLWAQYLLWKAVREPERKARWLSFWCVMGLALFAKGPVGLLFPFLSLLAVAFVGRRPGLLAKAGFWWGLPLAAAPIIAWVALVSPRVPGFVNHFFVNEVWNRIFDKRWPPDYSVSQVGMLGYLGVTAVWCVPWILVLPQSLAWAWRATRDGASRQDGRADASLILLAGALGPALIFLPMSSRLIYYSLPAVGPFVLLAAGWWLSDEDRKPGKSWLPVSLLLLLAGTGAVAAGFMLRPHVETLPEMQAAPGVLDLLPGMAWRWGAAFLLCAAFLLLKRPRAAAAWLILVLAWAWFDSGAGFHRFEDVRASRRLVGELAPALGAGCQWVAEGSKELGASAALGFYLGRDERGQPRTVWVLDDDPRRPQPSFGQAPRGWAITRTQLLELWESAQPVVFVTDPMRRSFDDPAEEPLNYKSPDGAELRALPKLGAPLPGTYGFRRVYANPAARARLKLK